MPLALHLSLNKMLSSQSIRDVFAKHATTHPDESFYLLVDHAGMPGLDRKLAHSRLEWVSLFAGTIQANALSVAPLLIHIGSSSRHLNNDAFLTSVCERGTYSSCLMLVASQLSPSSLASRLTARLDARISEDMDVLLRFFDPRVFEQLVLCLSSEQRKAFLSAGSGWWFVNRRGELRHVEGQFSHPEPFHAPLVLSESQENQLVDASEYDQVEEQLRLSVPGELSLLPPANRYEFINRHMATARDFRINSTREVALYCALALVYGADFSTRSEWASLLELIRKGTRDLTGVVSSLNESTGELESQSCVHTS